MRTLQAALAVLLVAGAASAQLDPEDSFVRDAFREVRSFSAAEGGRLWGVTLDRPVLFVDPETRACVASRADAGGLLSAGAEGVFYGEFPADRFVANATTTWSGVRWTMLVWPPPENTRDRVRLLMHESFHNAQSDLGISMFGAGPCAHLGRYSGRLWLRLEARALAKALESGDEQATWDALLFRAARRALDPEAGSKEDVLERTEGSAEYTGVVVCSENAEESARLAAETLRAVGERPSLERSFAYATGPALGLLLDRHHPHWREEFLAGRTLGAMLAPFVLFEAPADPTGLAKLARTRAEDYGFDEVDAEESAREKERLQRVAELRTRFVDGSILILPASKPNRSFDPNRVVALDGVGTVYGSLWVADEWGVADAPGGGLVRDDSSLVLPAPTHSEGPALAGDGWTLTLNPGWAVVPGARDGDLRIEPR